MNSYLTTIARLESYIRPVFAKFLPPSWFIKLHSVARVAVHDAFVRGLPKEPIVPPENLKRTLWGIEFSSPVFNAAGIFKDGDGYELVHAHGAGAYLAGTTTSQPRKGNTKNNIYLPFTPYPKSHAASNWLGLPNLGDEAVANRIKLIKKEKGCPIGASISAAPELQGDEKLKALVKGINGYIDAGVDFIELNESCPNTDEGKPQDNDLAKRLHFISENTIRVMPRFVPIIVKFSNDTELNQVPDLIKLLCEYGFDGVNFGNSSVNYALHQNEIDKDERKLFQYYTSTFGGGVTGKPLRECSLKLVKKAKEALSAIDCKKEFHIIRTGGIETPEDVRLSLEAGASLVQWYTGYFDVYRVYGHKAYNYIYGMI